MNSKIFTQNRKLAESISKQLLRVNSHRLFTLIALLFLFQGLYAQTCPADLGATVNIASLPYSGTGLTTCGAGNDITATNATICGSSSYYGGEDLVFIFTPTSSGNYSMALTSTSSWIGLMLYNGCPFLGQGGTCVGNVQSSAGSKTLTASLTAGVTYYLVVDTWPSPTCIPSFDLTIGPPPPPPPGDNCSDAVNLATLTSPFSGTTINSINDFTNTCAGGNTAGDLVYYINVNPGQTLTIGQTVNAYDSENVVSYGPTCPSTTTSVSSVQIACWDDPDVQNVVWTNNTGTAQTVWWVQDGFSSSANTGTFTLAWSLNCPAPTAQTATGITQTSANLGWTGAGSNWQIEYGPFGFVQGTGTTVTTASNPYPLAGLSAGTQYSWYIRQDCGAGSFSAWVGPHSFTTLAPPVVLNCPGSTTVAACQTQADVNMQFASWLSTASGSGGCNGVLTNNNTGAPSACGGFTLVTFTYTSTCAPFTTTCQDTFTVSPPPAIMLNCPMSTTTPSGQTQQDVDAAFATWLATASASGGCNGVLSNDNMGAPPATGGSTTVTFTYTSSCAPLTTTCQATFSVAFPGPPNDLCVNAEPLPGTTANICGTTIGAGADLPNGGATCGTGADAEGEGVWYTFVGDGQDWDFFFPAAGGWDPEVNVYSGTCGSLTCVTGDDDSGGGFSAAFTVNTVNGTTYYVYVHSAFIGETSDFCFDVTVPNPPVVLTCPTNTTVAACQTQAAVNQAFSDWLATASGTGGCNGVLTNNNTGAPSACGGSTTVTFTYTSTCGTLMTTCQATFTVASAPPVVLTCPTPTTASACLTQAQLNTAYANWLASASASGGCNGTLTNNAPAAPLICNPNSNTITVTFTYSSSCAPTTTTCTSTFTVPAYPTYGVPANGASTVACPSLIVQPTPPAVVDGCGKSVTPTGPVIVNSPNPITCEGTRTFTWTYTDCAGLVRTWSHVTTVERNPFTVPANGAATVNCPANATQPVPPVVLSNCGETITPTGPIVTNNPNPITCEGTRTYAWTYTDCEGNTATWSFVYTIERQPFGINTPNGSATVACPDQTDAQPTPPVVTSNCGEVLTPVITSTAKPGCEGNRNWFFTYTDCEGNTATWTFIYTVEYQDFAVPASEALTVNCPSAAVQPTPPVVVDNCGNAVNMSGPVVASTNNAQGCESGRSYTWTYQDCEGNTHTWARTYAIQYTGDFFTYPDGEDFVGCVLYAVPPVPPTVYDNCGQEVKITGPVVTENIDGCSGTRKYAYTYTSCAGVSKTWAYTYHANDNEPPVGNCTGGTLASVDVADLSCIGDVPCPDTYDFSAKAEELLAAGNFYDVCSGDDLTVELDSWTDLWECSDPDGDGQYTFGRTFYFRIADQCGNEYPTLCGVTYSGACVPMETFPQDAWGVAGGEPGTDAGGTDLDVLTALLNGSPLVVGGGNRSLTITDPGCVVALLPGLGTPTVLSDCHQVNCTGCNPAGPGGMKNVLAANTAALTLNLRYNAQYNGLSLAAQRSQRLECIGISPNIKYCAGEPEVCKLRVFESNGTVHEFPYTIGGLLDLSNLFLGGNLQLTATFRNLYAAALNESIGNVNSYFHGDMAEGAACDPGADAVPVPGDSASKQVPAVAGPASEASVSLAPNPAGSEVTFKLSGLPEAQEVTFEIYNQLGQLVLRREFGAVDHVSERVDLSGIGSGLYIVSVKAGTERFEQKLVVSKD